MYVNLLCSDCMDILTTKQIFHKQIAFKQIEKLLDCKAVIV